MSHALSAQEAERLNATFANAHPVDILRWAVETFRPDVALTASFGVKSAGILHMAVQVDPKIRVRFVDTGFHFPETWHYKEALEQRLGLAVEVFTSTFNAEQFKREHPDDWRTIGRHVADEHKVAAMERALAGLRCWITGISRTDARTRVSTPFVEVLSTGLVKVSPLAAWSAKPLHDYMTEHDLPYHPLWSQGYTSIGDETNTQKPVDPNDPRSGRWAGDDKTECGIHDIGKPKKDKK